MTGRDDAFDALRGDALVMHLGEHGGVHLTFTGGDRAPAMIARVLRVVRVAATGAQHGVDVVPRRTPAR